MPVRPLIRATLSTLMTATLMAGAGPSLAASHLPAVTDMAAQTSATATHGEPLVVLVSLPGCTYCEAVRRNYLMPQAAAGEITAREIDMTSDAPMRDADGTMTTARQWVRARNISFAPTVLFLDRNGRNLATPLRGMQADFYGAYLEQAIDDARAKLAASRQDR